MYLPHFALEGRGRERRRALQARPERCSLRGSIRLWIWLKTSGVKDMHAVKGDADTRISQLRRALVEGDMRHKAIVRREDLARLYIGAFGFSQKRETPWKRTALCFYS